MTPSNVLSRVRDQLVETTAGFWTDAELYRYMTDGETEINNRVECYQLSTAASTVTATSGYTMPSDALCITRITFDGVPLKEIDQRDNSRLDQPGYGGSGQSGDPSHYYVYGDKVYLWPKPARIDTINYYYVAQPVAITTASSSFSIPQQYHTNLQDYVLYRAFTKDQDKDKAEWHKREFIEGLLDAKRRERRRRWAGGFPTVKGDDAYSALDGTV